MTHDPSGVLVPTPADIPSSLNVATCDNGHTLRLAQVSDRFALNPSFIYIEPWALLHVAAQLILAMQQQPFNPGQEPPTRPPLRAV